MAVDYWGKVDNSYSEEVIQAIASRFSFDPLDTNFQWWLHNAGVNFLRREPTVDSVEQRKLEKRRFRALIKKSNELLDLFEPIEREALYPLTELAKQRALTPPQPKDGKPLAPLSEWGWHEEQWRRYIELGRDYATLELEAMQEAKGGRPAYRHYYEFARYLIQFWEEKLDRRFTFDHVNKTGLTKSYLFVRDCLEVLTPVDESKLVSAIRRELNEYSTYKNPRPKKVGVFDSGTC